MKHIIPILVILLLVSSGFVGMSNTVKEEPISDKDINLNSYDSSEIFNQRIESLPDESEITTFETNNVVEPQQVVNKGPMDSPWSMYCHDTRHTGRSPYSTVDNSGDEIWLFELSHTANGDVVIDDNGTIYFGANGLYALYSNGTLKWNYITHFLVDGAPAIAEDGTIYFGTVYGSPSYLYALYPNGTLKWKYNPGDSVFSSPAIADDGTLYFGDGNKYINALYPNGTIKWRYKTGHVVYSSPAIGEDGTVYCGSHDTYLYALYPDNGTVKWKYKTGDWIRTSPCIADDGTIYVVSLDYYLHALYSNGTLKWKTNVGAGASPTIGMDGTIYCGYSKFYAIYPDNGSVKWTFDISGTIRGGTPCNSIDGTIYVGTSDGGDIIAINHDGTQKWRKGIGECESAPAIGIDGTVYIGSSHTPDDGYFYAIGIGELESDADGPHYGLINVPVQFSGSATGGYPPYTYHWDFGDGNTSYEQNPMYTYTYPSNFTVTLTVTDNSSNTSDDTTWAWIQASNDPPNKPSIDGKINGKAGQSYDYTFLTTDPEGLQVWYYIEWGDDTNTGWLGPYPSDEEITKSHTWSEKDTYTIRCKAKDPYEAESEWGELEVTMPMNQQSQNWWFLQFLQNHPRMFPILRQLLGWYVG